MKYFLLIILGIFGVWVGKTLAEKTLTENESKDKRKKEES